MKRIACETSHVVGKLTRSTNRFKYYKPHSDWCIYQINPCTIFIFTKKITVLLVKIKYTLKPTYFRVIKVFLELTSKVVEVGMAHFKNNRIWVYRERDWTETMKY